MPHYLKYKPICQSIPLLSFISSHKYNRDWLYSILSKDLTNRRFQGINISFFLLIIDQDNIHSNWLSKLISPKILQNPFPLLLKLINQLLFQCQKNNSLSRDQNSLLKLIDHPVDSLRILINWASSKTSTCFLIAGKVHQRSVSNALIDTHCLLKIRYLSMSTLVLLQKSFSRFIYPIYGLIKVASVL